ncbi:MAG TPA: iron-containing alcohol dehydrogenase [Anditalea sp.]|nr:iron-containing alcohol dehydrogenase [Anditalea sp.]
MNNFQFKNPTKILFGKGQIANISKELHMNQKILMLYGGGSIKKNGVYDQVMSALKGYNITEFSGIEANPRYETCLKAIDVVKDENIEFILAVGGGSVIDAAKFIAAGVYIETDPWMILSDRAKVKDALPIGTVLTLPATASEMNGNSVITRESTKEKLAFGSPLVYPQFSVLDPETTFSLPKRQIANGVVDAFSHVMEQYMTYPADAPLQDRMAEGILLTLIEEGPKTYENPTDYNSRANIMWACTMALNGVIGVGVPQDWATHGIGHELTALFDIDHARTLAIVMPGIFKHKSAQKREKLLQYASRIWQLTEGSEEERINQAIKKTVEFFESLDIKTKLADYDVKPDAISEIADRLAKRNGEIGLGEHQDIHHDDVVKILEHAV